MRRIEKIKETWNHFAGEFSGKLKVMVRKYGKTLSDNRGTILYYSSLMLILAVLGSVARWYRGDAEYSTVLDETVNVNPVTVDYQQTLEQAEADEEPAFIQPVGGEILAGYSVDELVWSDSLGQWQTHPAVDISASAGEAVVACADGVVVDAYYDSLFGNTIIIDHGSGWIFRYSSLNTLELVEAGDKVLQGETVSAAGTCAAEEEIGVHVHVECYKDESPVDVLTLFAAPDSEN